MTNRLPTSCISSSDSYTSLWHWRLEGDNHSIGKALSSWGSRHLGADPINHGDQFSSRSQRSFFRRHYRPFYDRMEGVADAAEVSLEDPGYDFSTLWFDVPRPHCSAAFVPGERTADMHHRIIRNMDLRVDLTEKSFHPPSSRIIALEMAPSSGYRSLSVVVFDLMSAMDGINEKGLAVVCNSHRDYKLAAGYVCEPVKTPEPGLNELQVVRYLLDMCSDVEDCREALLSLRTYYCHTPCLYLICDARGRSLICEKSQSGNRVLFTENPNQPNIVTNFGLTRFARVADIPREDTLEQGFVYSRYHRLKAGLSTTDTLTEAQLAQVARSVSFDVLAANPRPGEELHPFRTIWTSAYDIDRRSMSISCYLGEGPTGTIRSEPLHFGLQT